MHEVSVLQSPVRPSVSPLPVNRWKGAHVPTHVCLCLSGLKTASPVPKDDLSYDGERTDVQEDRRARGQACTLGFWAETRL